MPRYVASRISGNDNIIFPDILEIDVSDVTFFKGAIIGYQKTVIARANIASVYLRAYLLFADVVIESRGGGCVVAHGFLRRKAREIVSLLS